MDVAGFLVSDSSNLTRIGKVFRLQRLCPAFVIDSLSHTPLQSELTLHRLSLAGAPGEGVVSTLDPEDSLQLPN